MLALSSCLCPTLSLRQNRPAGTAKWKSEQLRSHMILIFSALNKTDSMWLLYKARPHPPPHMLKFANQQMWPPCWAWERLTLQVWINGTNNKTELDKLDVMPEQRSRISASGCSLGGQTLVVRFLLGVNHHGNLCCTVNPLQRLCWKYQQHCLSTSIQHVKADLLLWKLQPQI